MQFVLSILSLIVLVFVCGNLGRSILNLFNIKEENKLLSFLINFSCGSSLSLMIVHTLGRITKNFDVALLITFVLLLIILAFSHREIKLQLNDLITKLKNTNSFSELLFQNLNKPLLTLFLFTNIIYGLTAFSSVKLEHFDGPTSHIFIANNLANGNYIDTKTNMGADIIAGIISKLSGLHAELSFDILSLLFLNLSLFAFFSLTSKYLNPTSLNKYMVPFAAFLAWGPITQLISAVNSNQNLPNGFLAKCFYLSQNYLNDAASWAGLVLHWFFSPSTGMGILFFLTGLHLIYKLLNEESNLKYSIFLGIYLSSLSVIDFNKLFVLILGIIASLLLSNIGEKILSGQQPYLIKNIGITLIIAVFLSFIQINIFAKNEPFIPLEELTSGLKSPLASSFGAFQSNALLIVIYIVGFYLSYRGKNSWIIFLIPFFVTSLFIPYIITTTINGIGKTIMAANLLGAFTIPSFLDFIHAKLNLKWKESIAANSGFILLISFSSLLFFAFGDKPKSLFTLENNKLKYTGLQKLPFSNLKDEQKFIKFIISKNRYGGSILVEPQYSETFSTLAGLITFSPDKSPEEYKRSFTLSTEFLKINKTRWLILSPQVFKYQLYPSGRIRFLDGLLSGTIKFKLSSEGSKDSLNLRELFEIDTKHFEQKAPVNKKNLNAIFSKTNKSSKFIMEAGASPYYGIYNLKSNDFDGDKVSDIAFFDEKEKIWHIIYLNKDKSDKIHLNENLLANFNDIDTLIPIPSDYDGDQKTDIALYNTGTASWLVLNSSSMSSDSSRNWSSKVGEYPLPANLDNDTKTDLSCYDSVSGGWHSFLSTNNEYYPKAFEFSPLAIPAYSDVDGDGKSDYIIYRPSKEIFNVYLSTRSYNPNTPVTVQLGNKNSRIVLEDYDGDSKVDLASWSPESGIWQIVYAKNFLHTDSNSRLSGCGITGNTGNKNIPCPIATVRLGMLGDIPMPGDYDGDGKTDIAVFTRETGKLEIEFKNKAKKILDLSKYKDMIPAGFIGI